nr:MAG TPA: hypothetical protein [Caudoviricetes sp.]
MDWTVKRMANTNFMRMISSTARRISLRASTNAG